MYKHTEEDRFFTLMRHRRVIEWVMKERQPASGLKPLLVSSYEGFQEILLEDPF